MNVFDDKYINRTNNAPSSKSPNHTRKRVFESTIIESMATTPHKGLCTLFDRGKYIWNGNQPNEKKGRMEPVKKCQFPELRTTKCISNRYKTPQNHKQHRQSVNENYSGIIKSKKSSESSGEIKKHGITKYKSDNAPDHRDIEQKPTKCLGNCHENCCKTNDKLCQDSDLSEMTRKEYQKELCRKNDCDLSSTSTNSSDHYHHHHHYQQQATVHRHQTKDQCDKPDSLKDSDVPHDMKLSGVQNYSLCPGAKNVNQLLAPRDNESNTCRHKSHQRSENHEQLVCYPSQRHLEIVSEKSKIEDNVKMQVSKKDECVTKKLELFKEIPEIPTALLLHRSRSLPQLSAHDSGVESVHDNNVQARCHSKLVNDLRQFLTLKQHYYPEGGWGWLILVVCILIQILSHGTHGAVGVLVVHMATKFNTDVYHQAEKSFISGFISNLLLFLMSSLSYSVFILRCLGLWQSDDRVTGWKAKLYIVYTALIFFIFYSFTLSHFIMLYECIDDANEFANASFMLLTLIAICGKMFNMISKRKVITEMMKTLQTHPFNPQDETELFINSECIRKTKLYTILYGLLTESTCTMLTLASLNRDVPHKELPYKAWLPYNTSASNTYWIAYLHQTIGLYIAANTDIGFDTFVPGLMIMTCGQLRIFNHRFDKLCETVKYNNDADNSLYHTEERIRMEKQLVASCTNHHSAIFQFAESTNRTFALSFFLQYCAGALVLCTSTYSLSRMEPFSQEFFSLALYLMCILTQLFIFCRYATEVELESEKINDAIYAADWMTLSVNTQKSLIIIMARTLHPIKYNTGHITLSLDAFSRLLKLSYSAYNVLQRSSD